MRIYLANLVEYDPVNSLHVHANLFEYIPTGTKRFPSEYTDTVMLCQGQRGIVEIRFPHPGRYMFHAHQSEFTELGGWAPSRWRREARGAGGAVLLAGCGGAPGTGGPASWPCSAPTCTPGTIELVVANGTDEPATLAQVAVDSGFVPYDGPPMTIAPHGTGRLAVPYPWIAGQGYSVKVLTGEGGALEYDLDAK